MPENSTRTNPGTGVAAVGGTIGVVYAAIGFVRGDVGRGLVGLAVIVVSLWVFHGLRQHSEAAQLLVSDPTDERQAQIVRNASAVTGQVLTGVLTVWWLVALAADADYVPVLTTLMAVLGFAFVGATFWFSRRG